jgi:hypothetical protein
VITLLSQAAQAQQFNSDSWFSKPYGVATIILTTGQRNTMLMNTFSLLPRWEFTFAAYLYNSDKNASTDDGYSMSLYAKYMIYENEAKNGGFAVKAGTGLDPGILDGTDRLNDGFKSYWMNAPMTLPFWGYRVSLDLMPGVSVTKNYGGSDKPAWAFTYSTRLALYPFGETFSVVGEVYGAEGQVRSKPEYRTGLRWEPTARAVFALTFDDEFHGSNGAGFEIGMMLFTPSFFPE